MGEAKRRAASGPPSRVDRPALVLSGMAEGDDVFCNDKGAWNVSRALADAEAGRVGERCLLDVAEAMEANAAITTDPDKVEAYKARPDVLARPLLAVFVGPRAFLIDGHHRLRAMAALGAEEFRAYLISAEDEARYRVRALRVLPGRPPEDVTLEALGGLSSGLPMPPGLF